MSFWIYLSLKPGSDEALASQCWGGSGWALGSGACGTRRAASSLSDIQHWHSASGVPRLPALWPSQRTGRMALALAFHIPWQVWAISPALKSELAPIVLRTVGFLDEAACSGSTRRKVAGWFISFLQPKRGARDAHHGSLPLEWGRFVSWL